MGLNNRKYPRTWRETSFDLKLTFANSTCLLVLFILGSYLTIQVELAISAAIAIVTVSISVRRRRRLQWRWPGTNAQGVLRAAGTVGLAAVFLYVAHVLFPVFEPNALPWYLIGVESALYNVLESLSIVEAAEARFLQRCITAAPATIEARLSLPASVESSRHRIVRAIHRLVCVAVALEFMAFMYFFGVYFRDGSPKPTPTQTERLSNHGYVVYIAPAQEHFLDRLDSWAEVCMPGVFALTVFMHFIVGVRLLPNTPTLRELRARKGTVD